jgi:hypothetical protein
MAYENSKAQVKQYKYAQAVSEQEALNAERVADKKSEMAQYKASQDAKQLQREYMVLEGAAESSRAASGLGGGSVSEGDIATDIFKTRKLDEMTIRHNADLASWEFRNEGAMKAWAARTEGEQYGMAAKAAKKAGEMSLMTSILFSAPASAYQAMGGNTYKGTKTTADPRGTAGGYKAYQNSYAARK